MRHMLASEATSAACAGFVGPGERLSTIGLPVLSMALRICRISLTLYGWSAMQSTLRRSTPQSAYCFISASYQACPAALSFTPQFVGSHGQASLVSAASSAWKLESAI